MNDVHVKIARVKSLGIYDPKKILLEQLGQQYLTYSKANKPWRMCHGCDRFSLVELSSVFGRDSLFEITPFMMEEYKAAMLEKVAPARVNRELACLKHTYTKAIEWGYVKTNPVKAVELLKEPPGRLRYLRPEEAKALIGSCRGYLRSIVITALNTGMRRAEILTLTWKDVELENCKVTARNTKNNDTRMIPLNMDTI